MAAGDLDGNGQDEAVSSFKDAGTWIRWISCTDSVLNSCLKRFH